MNTWSLPINLGNAKGTKFVLFRRILTIILILGKLCVDFQHGVSLCWLSWRWLSLCVDPVDVESRLAPPIQRVENIVGQCAVWLANKTSSDAFVGRELKKLHWIVKWVQVSAERPSPSIISAKRRIERMNYWTKNTASSREKSREGKSHACVP